MAVLAAQLTLGVALLARSSILWWVPARFRSTSALVHIAIEAAEAHGRAQPFAHTLDAGWKDRIDAVLLDGYGADAELMRRGCAAAPVLLATLASTSVDRAFARVHLADLLISPGVANDAETERIVSGFDRSDPARKRMFAILRYRACTEVRSRTRTSTSVQAALADYYRPRKLIATEGLAAISAFTVEGCTAIRLAPDMSSASALNGVWETGLRDVVVVVLAHKRDALTDKLLADWPSAIPDTAIRGATPVVVYGDGTSVAARAGDERP